LGLGVVLSGMVSSSDSDSDSDRITSKNKAPIPKEYWSWDENTNEFRFGDRIVPESQVPMEGHLMRNKHFKDLEQRNSSLKKEQVEESGDLVLSSDSFTERKEADEFHRLKYRGPKSWAIQFFNAFKLFYFELVFPGFWPWSYDRFFNTFNGNLACKIIALFAISFLNFLTLLVFYVFKLYFLVLILLLCILSKIFSEIFDLIYFIFKTIYDFILCEEIQRKIIHSLISIADHFLCMLWQYPFLSICYIFGYILSHYILTIFAPYFRTLESIINFFYFILFCMEISSK